MTVQRYRQMPAELDGVQLDRDTVPEAIAWLRQHHRDAYEGGGVLHVLPSNDATGFDVPFGQVLIRDTVHGTFAPVEPTFLTADRYVPVGRVEVRHPPQPTPRFGAGALERPLGQPGRGL